MKKNNTRISVTVPRSVKDAIKDVAEEKGLSVSSTVKFMLGRELAMEEIVDRGGEIIARDADGNEEVLAASTGAFVSRIGGLLPRKGKG